MWRLLPLANNHQVGLSQAAYNAQDANSIKFKVIQLISAVRTLLRSNYLLCTTYIFANCHLL